MFSYVGVVQPKITNAFLDQVRAVATSSPAKLSSFKLLPVQVKNQLLQGNEEAAREAARTLMQVYFGAEEDDE